MNRRGQGTNLLRKAILDQACAFEGNLKSGDVELLEIVERAGSHWHSEIIRKKGWMAFFLMVSLKKAGWFAEPGRLYDIANTFIFDAKKAIAAQLRSQMTQQHFLIFEELSEHGKMLPLMNI